MMRNKELMWYIWSNEHRAFWRPFRQGYTCFVKQAGKYTFKDAMHICISANQYVIANGPDGMDMPSETMVREDSIKVRR